MSKKQSISNKFSVDGAKRKHSTTKVVKPKEVKFQQSPLNMETTGKFSFDYQKEKELADDIQSKHLEVTDDSEYKDDLIVNIKRYPNIDVVPKDIDFNNQWIPMFKGFDDVVSESYSQLTNMNIKLANELPKSLFYYACYQALWDRILATQSGNRNIPTVLKQTRNRLTQIEGYVLPGIVVAYITNIGNYIDSAKNTWKCMMPPGSLNFIGTPVVHGVKGWYGKTEQDSTKMALMGLVPCPAIVTLNILNEVSANTGVWTEYSSLGEIEPTKAATETLVRTSGILGYTSNSRWAKPTTLKVFTNLGWSHDRIPIEASGLFNTCRNTIQYVSKKLDTIQNVKMAYLTRKRLERLESEPIPKFLVTPSYPTVIDMNLLMQSYLRGRVRLTSCSTETGKMVKPAIIFAMRYVLPEDINNINQSNPWMYKDAEAAAASVFTGVTAKMLELSSSDDFMTVHENILFQSLEVHRIEIINSII